MGAMLLAVLEESLKSIRPNDSTDFEGSRVTSTSLSDSDVDEELVAKPTSGGLQRSGLKMGPGETLEKRTYDVNFDYELPVERMRKCAKLEEQLNGLRALLPNSTRRRERNDPSVVMDAYRYIATLQQQVQDLTSELLECEELDSCHQEQTLSQHSEIPDPETMVEVKKTDGVMEVRILCAKRPGLLIDVMEAVESRGFTVTHARIVCRSDIVFSSLNPGENEEYSATISLSMEGGSEGADDEELDSVRTMFVQAIYKRSWLKVID